MARGQKAKQKELTPEERLQNALVPKEEWPYELPEGWKWVYFTDLIDIQGGTQPPKSQFSHTLKPGYIRLVQIRDFATDKYTVYVKDSDKLRHFNKDDILIARYGAFLGRICRGMEGVYNVALAKTIFPPELIDNDYLYWLLQSEIFQAPLTLISRTAQVGFNKNDLSSFILPLPPLMVQKKIAMFIDREFSRLDEAKEQVQSVLDSSEERKQSILHKAFTGELTEKWREENGKENTWRDKALEDVCDSIYDGDHMPPPKSESGIPFIVISNVNDKKLSLEDTRFVPEDYYENLTDTRKPQKGDVLYTLVGSFGIPVIVDTDRPFCFQRHMALLKPRNVDYRFLWYVLQTNEMFQKAYGIATGTAQLTVPIKGLRKLKIPYCDLDEQKEVVRILDGMWKKEETCQGIENQITESIDIFKSSLLSKAFHGKLNL